MKEFLHSATFKVSLVLAGIPIVCITFLEWATVTSWGWQEFWMLEILFIAPVFVILLMLLPCLIGVLHESHRRVAGVFLCLSIAYLLGFFSSSYLGNSVRMHAFHNLASRSTPLVNAIHAYENKYGHPPKSLSALVPEFIPRIPSTGMAAYPKYEYKVGKTDYPDLNDRWELYVDTPEGLLSWDRFMYWPKHNYPRDGYGGYIERIGDWAYVDE